MVLGKLDSNIQKNEIRTHPNTIHKNKLKWIKDLTVRPEIINLLEENIGSILFYINHSKILHDSPPNLMDKKTKISK